MVQNNPDFAKNLSVAFGLECIRKAKKKKKKKCNQPIRFSAMEVKMMAAAASPDDDDSRLPFLAKGEKVFRRDLKLFS